MKKILVFIGLVALVGCAEKQEYEQAVLEQMKAEKDIKDYKIEPEIIAECVVDTSSGNMPGLFSIDPDRLTAYKNYTKMLKLSTSSDAKKTLGELRADFGSAKDLAQAHTNYSESVLQCMENLVSRTENNLKDAEKQNK